MHIKKCVASCIVLLAAPLLIGSASAHDNPQEHLSVFRTYHNLEIPEISVPTRFEVVVPAPQPYGVALAETTTLTTQPIAAVSVRIEPFAVTESSPLRGSPGALTDSDYETVAEFDLDQDSGVAYAMIETEKPVSADGLYVVLDRHVALPQEAAVTALVDGSWKTLLARTKIKEAFLYFPVTTASRWKVELWHGQPLVLSELSLLQTAPEGNARRESIVWLARPGEHYALYTNAQAYADVHTGEAGDLLTDVESVQTITLSEEKENPLFVPPDDDEDGVANFFDNCIHVENPDQSDEDHNGRGDACEDHDRDGVIDSDDNCPSHPNSMQEDADGDNIGDACDTEESRLTEQLPWLPWVALGIAALIVVAVVMKTARKPE